MVQKRFFLSDVYIYPDLERAWSSFWEAKKIVSISCYCYFNAVAILNVFTSILLFLQLEMLDVPGLLARKLETRTRERRVHEW